MDSMWTIQGLYVDYTRMPNGVHKESRQNTRQGIAMAEFPSHFHHQFDFVNKIYIILQQYSYIYMYLTLPQPSLWSPALVHGVLHQSSLSPYVHVEVLLQSSSSP